MRTLSLADNSGSGGRKADISGGRREDNSGSGGRRKDYYGRDREDRQGRGFREDRMLPHPLEQFPLLPRPGNGRRGVPAPRARG